MLNKCCYKYLHKSNDDHLVMDAVILAAVITRQIACFWCGINKLARVLDKNSLAVVRVATKHLKESH